MDDAVTFIEREFPIATPENYDFSVSGIGWPAGTSRRSPPEFKRRLLAAAISYDYQIKSIDYVLKKYVNPDFFNDIDGNTIGDRLSSDIERIVVRMTDLLPELHSKEDLPFGVLGAEFTIFRVPHAIASARTLADKGALLEVLPILRLCLEMVAWSLVVFSEESDARVCRTKAQNCISDLKRVVPYAGKLYGNLSRFSHWGHEIHGVFMSIDGGRVGVWMAKPEYRAISLTLCLVLLDVTAFVLRAIYGNKANSLASLIWNFDGVDPDLNLMDLLAVISANTEIAEISELATWLRNLNRNFA